MIRYIIILFICNFAYTENYCQSISGIIVDRVDGLPLKYVNIGVLHKAIGTITDSKGHFELESKGILFDDSIRISMIGFKNQTFSVHDLVSNQLFALEKDSVMLDEVTIGNILLNSKIIGTKSTKNRNETSWGSGFGKGGEIGTKIKIGTESAVLIKELYMYFTDIKYDSALFRLHIRSLKNDLPYNEILQQNILFIVEKKNGWVNISLEDYEIWIDQDVSLTLESVIAWGTCNNGHCVSISAKKSKGGAIYAREANEVDWIYGKDYSLGIRVKIKY